MGSYSVYKTRFLKEWNEWEASLPEGEKAPSFFKKEIFLVGLSSVLQEKAWSKFLKRFDKAKKMAKAKDWKINFQSGYGRREHQHCIHEPSA